MSEEKDVITTDKVVVDSDELDEPIEVGKDNLRLPEDKQEKTGLVVQTQDKYSTKIGSEKKSKEKTVKNNLKEDDDFFHELAQERGYEFREDGSIKGSTKDDELKELRSKAARFEEVKEKAEELEELKKSKEREKILNIVPNFVDENAKRQFLNNIDNDLEWDEEEERYYYIEDGSRVYNKSGEPAGVEMYAEKATDEYSFYFEDTQVRNGPGVSPGNNTGGRLTERQFEEEYQKATKQNDQERIEELDQMLANDEIIKE